MKNFFSSKLSFQKKFKFLLNQQLNLNFHKNLEILYKNPKKINSFIYKKLSFHLKTIHVKK
jgi:hypothetical protein